MKALPLLRTLVFPGAILGLWLLLLMIGQAATAPGPAASSTAQPKRGGTLRLALPADVSSLDPARGFDTISFQFLLLLYQGLVEYGDGTELVPALATDWHLSPDRRTYTFHLRPGARFSNGRAVVAADFVYSLERTLDPKIAAPTESYFEEIAGAPEFRAGKSPHVRGLRAPAAETLEIELAAPDPTFLFILTLPGALVVPPEAVAQFGANFTAHPVGSGPYMLTEWQRGTVMRFARNPLSPQTNRQYLDAIEVRVGGDRTLHLMMFERGELDIAEVDDFPGIPIPDFLRIEQNPRWHPLIERIPTGSANYLSMNTEMPPFDNLKVRQAVNYAINKEKLIRLLHGMAATAAGILPVTMPGFNTNLQSYPYDPAKARQLLAEAGYAGGLTVELWCEVDPSPIPASLQYDLKQVGINAQLNPVTFPTLLHSQEQRKTAQCCTSAWSQDYPDPGDFLDVMFNGNRITESGCQNTSFYNNPRVNELLAAAATCPEPAQRLHLYQQAEQIIVTDAPCVPLYQPYSYALHQPWVHGVTLHPVVYFRFERMWLDR